MANKPIMPSLGKAAAILAALLGEEGACAKEDTVEGAVVPTSAGGGPLGTACETGGIGSNSEPIP